MSSDPRLAAGLKAHKAGRFGEAQGHYQALLDERPDHADALHLLGLTCHQSGDRARAVELISRAIVINDGAADYHNSLGAVHEALGSLADAAECYRRAIVRDAGFAKAHHNLGAVLQKSGDAEAAMSCFQTALSLRPDMAGSMDALGTTLLVLGRLEEAVACFRSALDMQPDCHRAYFNLLARASQLCDWSTQAALLPEFERRLSSYLRAGDDPRQLMPLAFALPYFRDDAVLHKTLLAGLGSHFEAEAAGRAHGHPPAPHSGRIRLGYVSANFGDHPIAQVTRPVLALHDRSEFEVAAYALAATDARSPIRRAVDRFVDLSAASTEDAARQIRADGIEILVDLGGYMRHARPALFALRPAPVQVYWLGHGGGLGAPYIDYVIGDPILTPPSEDDRFVECIARLPDSFSTAERALIAEESPSRADQALPEAAIVFAAFNNPLKIEPAVFDAWMRILDSVP
ncbi:MAG: tetratricopeptide repeat protein, partial [Alphaproteobacteria bacterium]|nr:tetratricopeptide repeat protein [Alphaproteobacteria bacterium]